MLPMDIESELLKAFDPKEQFSADDKNNFHVRLFRTLKGLMKEELLDQRPGNRKNRPYFIKDRERAQLMLDFDRVGWHVSLPSKELMISRTFTDKTYEAVIQSLSRYLLQVISVKAGLRKEEARTKSPGVFIFDAALPIPEQGKMVNEKFLILVPDDISAAKIKLLSNEKYKDFLQYLTSAWVLYFEEMKISHGNMVILHFPDVLVEKARRLIERSKARDLAEIVNVATQIYVDAQDSSTKPHFEIRVNGPFTKKAIETGLLKGGNKETVLKALEHYEERWRKYFMKSVE